MPVKVFKQSGTFRGKKFKYVTKESAKAPIKSRHTSKRSANISASIRNRALKRKGK